MRGILMTEFISRTNLLLFGIVQLMYELEELCGGDKCLLVDPVV